MKLPLPMVDPKQLHAQAVWRFLIVAVVFATFHLCSFSRYHAPKGFEFIFAMYTVFRLPANTELARNQKSSINEKSRPFSR